jgi:hypothetical protein
MVEEIVAGGDRAEHLPNALCGLVDGHGGQISR